MTEGAAAGTKDPLRGRATTVLLLGLALLLMAGSCTTSSEQVASGPGIGEDLTTGQKVLNVVSFPFRMIGYAVYYPLKFIFYDIWAALFGWIFGSDDDGEPTVDDLVERLRDPDPAVRLGAAVALGDRDGEAAARALLAAIEDPEEGVRAAAVASLGEIGKGRVEDEAARLLEAHERPEVRSAAALVLGLTGAESKRAELAASLEDKSWRVRSDAAIALGLLGSWLSGPALGALLEDEDPRVRLAAARALGDLGDLRALPFLEPRFENLSKEGTAVRAEIITTLGRIGAHAFEDRILAVAGGSTEVKDPHSKAASLWALGALKVEKAHPLLKKVLLEGRESLNVLEGAAMGLALLGARDVLVEGAASKEVMVRIATVRGVIDLAGDEAVGILSGLVGDPYADVRQRAIWSLLVLGQREAVVFVIDQLRSLDPEIRAWAFLELKRISGTDLGLEPGDWLEWWKENRESWDLRRYYPEPVRSAR